MNWRIAAGAGAGVLAIAIAAALFVFQDNLFRFSINPRTPFQTYQPPPPPDYAALSSWAAWPAAPSAANADIFYVHSTTYYDRSGWNAPATDPDAAELVDRVALPNEAGPFYGLGNLYAPRYRQATLYAFFTNKDDGREARQTAYRDIRRAFETYLAQREEERPIILAGYGQGGLHVIRLLQEFFEAKPLGRYLAAAYVIDQAAPVDMNAASLREIAPCAQAEAIRCIASWNAFTADLDREILRAKTRSMVWNVFGRLVPTEGRPLICVNPISWRADGDYATPSRHLGGAPAAGLELGEDPVTTPHAVGARCEDGVLITDQPRVRHLRRKTMFGGKWKIQNYNLFYEDIRSNAALRLAALEETLSVEARRAPPLEEPVDIRVSPVNPVDG